MVANSPPQRLTLSPQLKLAALGGGLVALGFVVMPSGLLERLVSASGIPAVLAAAEPPLGMTARIGLGGLLGGLFAAFLWVGLGLLDEDSGVTQKLLARFGKERPAPRRAPLSARELGEPTPPLPVERDLPLDLDQPLSAFDPAAIPAAPLLAPEPLAPLVKPSLLAKVAAAIAPAPAPPSEPAAQSDPRPEPAVIDAAPIRPSLREPVAVPEQSTPAATPARPPSLRLPPANSLRTLALRDAELRAPIPTVLTPRSMPTAEAPAATPAGPGVLDLLARLERGLAARPASSAPTTESRRFETTLDDLRRMAVAGR